jgi:hypothetical protein
MLACPYAALDRPMILFQNALEILHRSMVAVPLQSALGFELLDGRPVNCILSVLMIRGCRMPLTRM